MRHCDVEYVLRKLLAKQIRREYSERNGKLVLCFRHTNSRSQNLNLHEKIILKPLLISSCILLRLES